MISLYVGPSRTANACIRGAIVRSGQVYIVTTSKYTAATDGGGLNIYPHIQKGTQQIIEDLAIENNENYYSELCIDENNSNLGEP